MLPFLNIIVELQSLFVLQIIHPKNCMNDSMICPLFISSLSSACWNFSLGAREPTVFLRIFLIAWPLPAFRSTCFRSANDARRPQSLGPYEMHEILSRTSSTHFSLVSSLAVAVDDIFAEPLAGSLSCRATGLRKDCLGALSFLGGDFCLVLLVVVKCWPFLSWVYCCLFRDGEFESSAELKYLEYEIRGIGPRLRSSSIV